MLAAAHGQISALFGPAGTGRNSALLGPAGNYHNFDRKEGSWPPEESGQAQEPRNVRRSYTHKGTDQKEG
eukprot:10747367-Heterocapsa_arctica.AAC.1